MTGTIGIHPELSGTPDGAPAAADGDAARAEKKRGFRFRFPKISLPKMKRPRFGIRRFAREKINQQLKGDKLTPGRAIQELLTIAGFGGVVDAWKHPTHRTTKVIVSLVNKAADMMAGRFVNMTIRLVAISMLTGFFGAGSVLLTMALTGLATGVGSALYTYHRNYLHDKLRGPKEDRKHAKYVTRERLHQAGMAFIGGCAGGAFGAWLGKTDFMQSIVKSIKGFVHHLFGAVQDGVSSGASAVESVIVPQQPAAPATVLPPSGTLQKAFDGAALPHGPAATPAVTPKAAPVLKAAPASGR
ncbi:MAG: hypothetical protein GC185_01120 [Alphaproteobacteria bacterium]|nr:hypothetical protein [Alphaproteobacteria bacterium]